MLQTSSYKGSTMKNHKLSCHCGAVELRVDLLDGVNTARRCNCSYCAKRGNVSATVPLNGLRIIKGADSLTLYQWNTKTAKHYFCKNCGIYTHHQRRSNPNEYGVNVAGLEGIHPEVLGEIPWSDGINHSKDRA